MTGVGSELPVEPKKEKPLIKVTKDVIGDLVLEPIHVGADLKMELDAVQPAEVKEGKKEEKGEGEQKAPVLDKPKKSSKRGSGRKGRRKTTTK